MPGDISSVRHMRKCTSQSQYSIVPPSAHQRNAIGMADSELASAIASRLLKITDCGMLAKMTRIDSFAKLSFYLNNSFMHIVSSHIEQDCRNC